MSLTSSQIVRQIRAELKKATDPKAKAQIKRYFKEPIRTYGIKSPVVAQLAKPYYQLLAKEPDLSWRVAAKLFRSGYLEEGGIATGLLARHLDLYSQTRLSSFDRWIDWQTNWARVDDFSWNIWAKIFISHPKELKRVFVWLKSPNRWRRRTATVSLIYPVKKHGLFINQAFKVAKSLVGDHDDLIQKAVGWLLREVMVRDKKRALAFLKENREKASGILLSYACEKLPKRERVYKRK